MREGGNPYLVSVGAQGHAKCPRETKIRQLQIALLVDEQVLGLEVAMQDAVGVAVFHTVAQLLHELLDHGFAQPQMAASSLHDALGQWLAAAALRDGQRLHVLLQIEVQVLEDEVEFVAVGVHDVEQAHDVGVVHFFQEGDFADRGRGNAFVFGF